MSINNILVTMYEDGSCIALKTMARKIGAQTKAESHGRFLVDAKNLDEWLDNNCIGTFWDTDCGNVLKITRYNQREFHLDILWLSEWSNGHIEGTRQTIDIPVLEFYTAIHAAKPFKYLAYGETAKAMRNTAIFVWHDSAKGVVRSICKSPTDKRAFVKGLMRLSMWYNTTIDMYRDGPYDFYFRTNDGISGGLIRHEYGGKVTYQTHT